ncbi:hypothetical protein VKT23_010124 [Stygiomarasmius scandens]|uniref:Uncharacterized protein n=1 Tax=Marasmiellus scandens TaxID=2682957 RepID=A0ABR1JEV7_9AGAR
MDTLNRPYRRIITYSRKLRRSGRPLVSENLGHDSASSLQHTISGDVEHISEEKNESKENELEESESEENGLEESESEENGLEEENESRNDVSDAQEKLQEQLVKALSCPICFQLSMPPCYVVVMLCVVDVYLASASPT